MSASKVRVHELLGPLSVNKKTLYSWYDMVGDMLLRIRLKKKKKVGEPRCSFKQKKTKTKKRGGQRIRFLPTWKHLNECCCHYCCPRFVRCIIAFSVVQVSRVKLQWRQSSTYYRHFKFLSAQVSLASGLLALVLAENDPRWVVVAGQDDLCYWGPPE